jgi:hypothetical protein
LRGSFGLAESNYRVDMASHYFMKSMWRYCCGANFDGSTDGAKILVIAFPARLAARATLHRCC